MIIKIICQKFSLGFCTSWCIVEGDRLNAFQDFSRFVLPMYDLHSPGLQLICNFFCFFFSVTTLSKQQAAKIMSVTFSGDSLMVVKNTSHLWAKMPKAFSTTLCACDNLLLNIRFPFSKFR